MGARLWLGWANALPAESCRCLVSHQRGGGGQTHPPAGGCSASGAPGGGREAGHELSQAWARILGDAVACLIAGSSSRFLQTRPSSFCLPGVAVPLALQVDLCFFSPSFLLFSRHPRDQPRTTYRPTLVPRHCIETTPRPRHGRLRQQANSDGAPADSTQLRSARTDQQIQADVTRREGLLCLPASAIDRRTDDCHDTDERPRDARR